jgi:hypothetical protein
MFRWRRGHTRGGCIVIPCGCLASLPFVLLGVVVARLFAFRRIPRLTGGSLQAPALLAGFGEKGS